jgi:thiol-disulfide isomerase/thioredoxin
MTKAALTATIMVLLSSVALGQDKGNAPQLELKDTKGRALRLSDYKGRVVLLNFWATWCAPCQAEMPDLIKWQREYRRHGLQIIGVTYPPDDPAEVRKFIKSVNVNYPIAFGEKQTKAIFDEGATIPISVVIDKSGVVREVIKGIIFPEEFEQKIKPLLR